MIAKTPKMRFADSIMNAQQIIAEITQLPSEEKSKIVDFVRHLPNQDTIEAMEEPIEGLPRFDSVEALMEELQS